MNNYNDLPRSEAVTIGLVLRLLFWRNSLNNMGCYGVTARYRNETD